MSQFGFRKNVSDPLVFPLKVHARTPSTVVPLSDLTVPITPARDTSPGSAGGPSALSQAEARVAARNVGHGG